MNVKIIQILLMLLLGISCQDQEESVVIATLYKNPYLNILSGIRNYCHSLFERVKVCVKYQLLNNGKATGDQILKDCTGLRFEVLDKIYRETIDRSVTVFMKIFSQRLFPLRYDFSDEITHFITRFKFMLKKNFIIFTSLQSTAKRSYYYTDKGNYYRLLDVLEPELLLFSKFQGRLKADKKDLTIEIDELIRQRDKDLELLHKERDNPEEEGYNENQQEDSEDILNLAEELDSESDYIDQQLNELNEHHYLEDLNDEIEHEIHRKPEFDKEKFVEYKETNYSELDEDKKEISKQNHTGHDTHLNPHYDYPKKKEIPQNGYFLDDSENLPYTKMETLKLPKEIVLPTDPF